VAFPALVDSKLRNLGYLARWIRSSKPTIQRLSANPRCGFASAASAFDVVLHNMNLSCTPQPCGYDRVLECAGAWKARCLEVMANGRGV